MAVFTNRISLMEAVNDYLNNPTTTLPHISTWDVSTRKNKTKR
jgi:hypothetical protein